LKILSRKLGFGIGAEIIKGGESVMNFPLVTMACFYRDDMACFYRDDMACFYRDELQAVLDQTIGLTIYLNAYVLF
jgi:hypothetical protein